MPTTSRKASPCASMSMTLSHALNLPARTSRCAPASGARRRPWGERQGALVFFEDGVRLLRECGIEPFDAADCGGAGAACGGSGASANSAASSYFERLSLLMARWNKGAR